MLEVSWLMTLPRALFFWFVMHMAAFLAVYSMVRLAVLGMMLCK
jgi:hypothetical protein